MKYTGPFYKLRQIHMMAVDPKIKYNSLKYHQKNGWKPAGIDPERITIPNQFGGKNNLYTEKGKNAILEFLERK